MIFQGLEEIRADRARHQSERRDAFLEAADLVRHWGLGVADPKMREEYARIAAGLTTEAHR